MACNILVVAAHPDDEILGCGATMAKHIDFGDKVTVLIAAEGVVARVSKNDKKTYSKHLAKLESVAIEANNAIGVKDVSFLRFPDNRMDSIDLLDVVKVIEVFVGEIKPDVVYTHYGKDLNVDHRIVNQGVVTACRFQPGVRIKSLLFFEVPSSTEWQMPSEFQPNWFVDVTSTLEKKINALKVYAIEMRKWPHARSLEAVRHLAAWRGTIVGVNAAEAFILGRGIF